MIRLENSPVFFYGFEKVLKPAIASFIKNFIGLYFYIF